MLTSFLSPQSNFSHISTSIVTIPEGGEESSFQHCLCTILFILEAHFLVFFFNIPNDTKILAYTFSKFDTSPP